MATKRNLPQRISHRRQVERLYLEEGLTQVQIAERLGINQSTVSRDLTALRKQWQAETKRRYASMQAELLKKMDAVYQEAAKGWQVSQKTQVTAKGVVEGKLPGDSKFLETMRKTLVDTANLIGVGDEAIKLQPETILIMQALGLSMSDVAAAFNAMVKEAAKDGVNG